MTNSHYKKMSRHTAKASPVSRSQATRDLILATAMRNFAEKGYEGARVADMAEELGIAKGSIFQHFGSKESLFLEVYKKATRSFAAYLDVPDKVREGGFFEVLRYWLLHTEHMVQEDWIPYRVQLLGNYGASLTLKREINRFLLAEDPFGRVAFVQFGLARGELRDDLHIETIVSFVDWTVERFQDALLVEELDPGLFRRPGHLAEKQTRIQQFLNVLRRAVGTEREGQ